MLPRYTREPMARLWSTENRYRLWLRIEAHASEALARLGTIPQEAADALRDLDPARINPDRIDEIERETRHDVVAFLTHLAELIGPQGRYIHRGLTSSDVVDTGLAVQLAEATDLLLDDLDQLLAVLHERAIEYKHTPCMGRTHGVHAEPTSFGLKLAQAWSEMKRNRARLARARTEVAVCVLSGAVGTYANIDPAVEAHVASELGLAVEPISSQVIPRDRHATYFTTLAVIAASVERIATEIRHLQRTEVGEVEEPFASGQRGSSAMPHKRNPIQSENLTGLARLVRMAATPALENVPLWHERDISHSSVERVIAPDTTATLDFALVRLASVIRNLTVRPERMAANLDRLRGTIYSQRALLFLTDRGMSRAEAHEAVRECAAHALAEDRPLIEILRADSRTGALCRTDELETLFDAADHLQQVDAIFERVFAEED